MTMITSAATVLSPQQFAGAAAPLKLKSAAGEVASPSPTLQLSSKAAVSEPRPSGAGNVTEDAVGQSGKAEEAAARQQRVEKAEELRDRKVIQELSARDREVRAHEQAHAAAGGRYSGAPTYQYQRGPDGVNYAVGGEVPIDIGRAATPRETIAKAQIVKRAALAPAEPSAQDRKVAAEASRLEASARAELSRISAEEARIERETAEQARAADEAPQDLEASSGAGTGTQPRGQSNTDGAGEAGPEVLGQNLGQSEMLNLYVQSGAFPNSGQTINQFI